MTQKLVIRPDAEKDIFSAYDWYEEQREGHRNSCSSLGDGSGKMEKQKINILPCIKALHRTVFPVGSYAKAFRDFVKR